MRTGSGSNAPPICFTKNKSSIMSKPSAKQHTAKYDEHTIETPATLMEFLTSTYEGSSRTTVKSYLTHGQVTVGGVVKTKFDTPLTAGDIVRVTFGHVEKPFTHKMLRFKVLKSNNRYSLVECELDTGKKNQIRVHMRDKGSPIIGDKRYGGIASPIGRVALHARRVRFIHPATGETLTFDTGVPGVFEGLF